MEWYFTALIVIAIIFAVMIGFPTIYDRIIYGGNHLFFIDPSTRTARRGGKR
jgi:hypothetical protein